MTSKSPDKIHVVPELNGISGRAYIGRGFKIGDACMQLFFDIDKFEHQGYVEGGEHPKCINLLVWKEHLGRDHESAYIAYSARHWEEAWTQFNLFARSMKFSSTKELEAIDDEKV